MTLEKFIHSGGYNPILFDCALKICLLILFFSVNLKRGNFRCTESSVGVEAQLSNLATVTQIIDPKLHQHLGMFIFLYHLVTGRTMFEVHIPI